MSITRRAKFTLLAIVILALVLITCSSCSVKQFYPLGGSVLGGAAGSVGGPVTGGLGAGAGWAAGEIAKGDKNLEEARETIKALSTGDVDALVEQRMEEARDNGFFDEILDGIYDLLWICTIGITLWIAVPMWYTHYIVKKKIPNKEK